MRKLYEYTIKSFLTDQVLALGRCTRVDNIQFEPKTAATGWWNAGAASTQTITSDDGYVETTVGTDLNLARFFGLSDSDPNQHYTSIDFGLLMNEPIN